jgi:oligopeptide transport system substrate-binding protein
VAATLVAAACGGAGDGDAGAPDQPSADDRSDRQADEPSDDDDGAPADAAPSDDVRPDNVQPTTPAAPRVRGELRIARPEPITLDPALTTDATSASYVVEIFGGLVTLDQDLNIVPDLAEALPEPIFNDDGTVTYRFVLRRDALFHNGRRVTADDVKWSIERNASPETFSPTAIDYLGDIAGAKDHARGRVDGIAGIEVIDERTIEFTVDSAKPYFLAKLTYPTAFVIDRTQVENDPTNWTRNPNGTGPFRLEEWQLGQEIVLAPNERYHLGAPLLDSVRIRFAGGGLTQYENNEVDIATVGVNDIERVRDPGSNLNDEFVSRSELSVFYLGFNVDQPPFDDPLVRRAFAQAIDKQTIIEVVLQDVAIVADGIVPPGIPGFTDGANGLPFDPDEARELLSRSTYAGTPLLNSVRVTLPGAGATPGPVVEAIRQMWRENLDLEVEIQQVELANFYSELDRGLYQLFSIGWILDYPDPENVLDLLFHSRSLQNNTAYRNPTLDAIIEEARTEQDPQRRIDLYKDAEAIIIDDAVWVPLFFGQSNEVVKPYVQGYLPPRSIVPYLRLVSVGDPE